MKFLKDLFYGFFTDKYLCWLVILFMGINFIHDNNFGGDWLFFGATCVLCWLVGMVNGERKSNEERVKELEKAIDEHNKKVEEKVSE